MIYANLHCLKTVTRSVPLYKSSFSQRVTFVFVSMFLVGLVFVTTPVTEHNGGYDSDGMYYGAMAGDGTLPASFSQTAPWSYRIVTPWLASLLPFETLTNFRVLAFISNVLSIIIFTLILERLSLSLPSRIFGILLYAGSFWTLKFSFYSPAYIDYQTQLLLLLIIYLTLSELYILLPLTLTIAALQKEAIAAYALFSTVCFWRHISTLSPRFRRSLTLAILFAPFAALLVVRLTVDVANTYSPLVITHHLQSVLSPSFWPILLQAGLSGLGLIPLILFVRWKPWVALLRRQWEWVIYALLSCIFLFGGVDKARLFLYVLPLAAILASAVFESLRQDSRPAVLVTWSGLMLIVHFYMGGYLTPMGSFTSYLSQWVPEHSAGSYVSYLIRNLFLVTMMYAWTILCFRQKIIPRPQISDSDR